MKVFLVEDEIIVREGIKRNIEWEKEGFDFVGEASDGELAYPLIVKEKPDILITDIKMPFMDGLELSRLIKQEMPWIKIIILSGYDEFQYAKESINIGVTEYLSKPITGEELLKTVKRIKYMIEKQREEEEKINQLRIDVQKSYEEKKQEFFMELISKKSTMSEILSKAVELQLNLVAQRYNIILFKFYENGVYNNTGFHLQEVKNRVKEKLEDNIIIFQRPNEETALLLKANHMQELEDLIKSSVEIIEEQAREQIKIQYFIGIGIDVERISELAFSYHEASKAFAYRYLLDKNQIIFSKNLDEYQVSKVKECNLAKSLERNLEKTIEHNIKETAGMNIKVLDIYKIDKSMADNFLKIAGVSEVHDFLEKYFNGIGNQNLESLLFRQYITMDLYLCCIILLDELGVDVNGIEKTYGNISKISAALSSVEETKEYIEKLFITVIQHRTQKVFDKYKDIINTAKEYIFLNYCNENISLNAVAKKVNISPSYFSTIFSQEVGTTFIEYLTDLRMTKAKHLLKCSSMKSSEIGYAVGYKDPHYFSYIFKKTQKCSPKEYRGKQ